MLILIKFSSSVHIGGGHLRLQSGQHGRAEHYGGPAAFRSQEERRRLVGRGHSDTAAGRRRRARQVPRPHTE